MKIFYQRFGMLSCALLLLVSCDSNKAQIKQFNTLYDQVLEIHDEVMPKIVYVPELSKKLLAKAKQEKDTSNNIYRKAEKSLQSSDSLMMDWMHRFSDAFVKNKYAVKKMSSEEIAKKNQALKQELEFAKSMRDTINASIENANRLINNSNK